LKADGGPGGDPARAERLGRSHRLRRRREFLDCYGKGSRVHSPVAVLHVRAREGDRAAPARLGITASRKVAKAARRTQLKRWVRETFRRWPARERLAGLDIVVHLRREARDISFHNMKQNLEGALWRIVRKQ
jgi:ribonuclease P protein component